MKSYRNLFTLLLGILFYGATTAANPESARILIHTLNYIGSDYKNAVADGKVINQDEYKEMEEFCENIERYFQEYSVAWSDTDSVQVGSMVQTLVYAVQQKAAPDSIAAQANRTKKKILAVTGLQDFPFRYPDIVQGKKLYSTQCVRCHGDLGKGDGPDGGTLNPKPRNLLEDEWAGEVSPAQIFNTVRLGVEGTGMPAYPTLSDDEVWNLAFFVNSLHFSSSEAQSAAPLPTISLKQIATLSDDDLKQQFHLSTEQLAALRLIQAKPSNDLFLKTAENYLGKALSLYREGNAKEAARYASMAYLEGIEPIELHVKASDPELSVRIERQFLGIRKMIAENRGVSEVSDSVQSAKVSIGEASEILQKRDYSFWIALLMSMAILLREGLEAFLVILVILTVLKAAGLEKQVKWVHFGWISAILVGVVLWFVSGEMIAKFGGIEAIEGFISLFAVAVLLYIGFWLHGKSEMGKWKEYIKSKIHESADSGSVLGMASLSFFVVFREVFESVLFLSALSIEAGSKQSSAIALGVVLAFVIVLLLAYVVIRFSTRLPIPTLFRLSLWVMGLLAFVLIGKGIHSFQEVGYLSVHGLPIPRIELLGIYPTAETVAGQVLILIILFLINRQRKP